MYETVAELDSLQKMLDASAGRAGAHLRSVLSPERALSAPALCARLTGMRLLTVATVTADGRPIAGPVDGYFLHGAFWFSTSAHSVRARHLSARPAVSVTHVPDDRFAVSAHGTAGIVPFPGSETSELRQAMLDHYVPLQGPSFRDWLDAMIDGVAVRVDAAKVFVYAAA